MANRDRKKGPRVGPRPGRLRGPFWCKCCGSEYQTRRPKGEGELFCSRGCSFDYKHERKIKRKLRLEHDSPAHTKIYISNCVECDGPILGRTEKSLCSQACSVQNASRKHLLRMKAAHQADPSKHLARCVCGVESCRLYGMKNRLCPPCADDRKREGRREYKKRCGGTHISRAKHYGCDYVQFDPLTTLQRDGWRCRICDCSTPERLRGTQDDNAPELDHIIPLAVGGKHTPENTQCLCRVCNSIKGTQSQSYMVAYHGEGRVRSPQPR
jgi:hypothetical protein